MEKEQILSLLTEKLGNTSFSQQSLQTYVENNLPAEGTEPDDAYWSRHTSILNSFQGQFNHDVATKVTEQAQAKFEEYKKSFTVPDTDPKPDGDGGESQELVALKQELEDLKKQFSDSSDRLLQSELQVKVKEYMKQHGADDAYVLEKTLSGRKYDTTKSVEELSKAMLSEYDKEYKACRGEDSSPRMGSQFAPGGKSKTDLRFEAKKRRQQAMQK